MWLRRANICTNCEVVQYCLSNQSIYISCLFLAENEAMSCLHTCPLSSLWSCFFALLYCTRPKPAYGRQGLGWDHWVGTFWGFLNVLLRASGAQLGLVDGKAWDHWHWRRVPGDLNDEWWIWPPWLKNVTSLTRGPNRPPLIQKTSRHSRGAPTDLHWSKKRHITHGGPQPTF